MSYFLIYLIKSTIYLALFYVFFMVVIRNTTFFRLNRWMLLLGTLVCMLLPCCNITIDEIEGIQLPMQVLDEVLFLKTFDYQIENTYINFPLQEISRQQSIFILPYLLIGIYMIGLLVYVMMVVRSFAEIWKLIKENPKQWINGCWLVVVSKKISSFCWGNYIVMSEEDYKDNPFIMVHERMHYQCHHTFDIHFFTVIHAIHWFNPMVWIIRMELKQLHEFEADEGVINQGIDATQYQLLLVRKAVGKKLYTLAHGFNHTPLKKRITMMIQEKSKRWERLKWIVSVPVMMCAMLVFAQPTVKNKLDQMLPVTNQENLEELKSFFKQKRKIYEEAATMHEINGQRVQIVKQSQAHLFRVNKRNQILVGENGENEIYISDLSRTHTLREQLAHYLRIQRVEAEKQSGESTPMALLFVHDKESHPDSLFSYLKQIKLAFDDIRSDYPQDDQLDRVCPYWLVYVAVDEYANFARQMNIEVSLYDKQGSLLRAFKNFTTWELRDFINTLPKEAINHADLKFSSKASKGEQQQVVNTLRKCNVLYVNVNKKVN